MMTIHLMRMRVWMRATHCRHRTTTLLSLGLFQQCRHSSIGFHGHWGPDLVSRVHAGSFRLLAAETARVQMMLAAMVTSMNPSLIARQTTGTDSEEVGCRPSSDTCAHMSLC